MKVPSLSARQPAARSLVASVVGLLFLLLLTPILISVFVALLVRGVSIFTVRCVFDGREIGLLEFSCPPGSFGDFLWHTRLNQLPTVFNVVCGDVALDARLLTLLKEVE